MSALCVDYLADLGRHMAPASKTRRTALLAAYEAIQQHERRMAEYMIAGLVGNSRAKILRDQ